MSKLTERSSDGPVAPKRNRLIVPAWMKGAEKRVRAPGKLTRQRKRAAARDAATQTVNTALPGTPRKERRVLVRKYAKLAYLEGERLARLQAGKR